MKKDITLKAEQTKVIFKREGKEVIAFFPELASTWDSVGYCPCYERVGQHGSASVTYASSLKPAKEFEYRELKSELEKIGYSLCVGRKFT